MYNNNSQSFQHVTPNSRIVPNREQQHINSNTHWRQPARTSSLQNQCYTDRESLIDPTPISAQGYYNPSYLTRETYIEPNVSTFTVENCYPDHNSTSYSPVSNLNYSPHHQQQQLLGSYESSALPDPEIQTVNPPKSVKSNVQHVSNSSSPIQVQHAYVKAPQPSFAVLEQTTTTTTTTQSFLLQPVPSNKKINSNSTSNVAFNPSPKASTSTTNNGARLPKPPLTPLVIPPTPIRSSSSPNGSHHLITTPTRSSSIQQQDISTPGGLSTPGSSRSAYSPVGLSPFYSPSTPSPNTYLPHATLPSPLGTNSATMQDGMEGIKKAIKANKKLSIQPEGEAERLVHQGIKCHEAGKLEQATEMFKQASMLDLPIAMFLYGVSLRHGWGCKRNEHLAFQYLQKAAEHAVEDLSHFSTAMNTSAAKSELIMAIYELGVSFRHGWGCKKNKETAVYYFKIAADLNDADAQNDLGHCYYHGHGVKKDLHMAAKYYRLADKQGQGIMGNSWIWKSKYDNSAPHSKK